VNGDTVVVVAVVVDRVNGRNDLVILCHLGKFLSAD
jgi:hypothetical protein